jgi:Tol biopolymer transport system component/predicted aspartyl protease
VFPLNNIFSYKSRKKWRKMMKNRGFIGNAAFIAVLLALTGLLFAFPDSPVSAQDQTYHSADYKPADWQINLSELLRMTQLYNSGAYHCESANDDGYGPGTGNQSCGKHDSDYKPADWQIGLNELLRLVQFYNASGYHTDPAGEDGFAPGSMGNPVSLSISPENAPAVQGHIKQFKAEISYKNGVTQDVTATAEWSSSKPSVAAVSNETGSKGLTTALSAGSAVISAAYEGMTDTATFTVDEPAEGSVYEGTETSFTLKRGGADQFLLPVEIGNQTLNLLVDTGSNALLVFDDRLAKTNASVKRSEQTVTVTETKVSTSVFNAVRSGLLATAPVRIGAYFASEMRIMLIQTPDSQSDAFLTAKGADGIIGLRRTEGVAQTQGGLPDVPLTTLRPSVSTFEMDLPLSGDASLTFGEKPVLDLAQAQYVFRAKTFSVKDPANPVGGSYSELQIPFRAKSSFGSADAGNLDILLDTGSVGKLVLDTEVAKSLGYNPETETWTIPQDEEIELNLAGSDDTITIYPKFRVSEISVAPYSKMGVEFEAVLGIYRWQEFVVGFDFVDYQDGGPDGTVSLLRRSDRKDAVGSTLPTLPAAFVPLEGLNAFGDDRFPACDASGSTVVFQSDRPGGKGGWDIYVWRKDAGLLNLPNLNSTGDDSYPRISADGRYVVFHSDREGGAGGYDVYVFDLTQKDFVSLPGLNTASLERNPWISADGTRIAFRSERPDGKGGSDIYLYDRNTQNYVSLPRLNTSGEESLPALNEDGSLLSFTGRRADSLSGGPDIYLYDVKKGEMISLPKGMGSVNTAYREQFSAISPDNLIAFQTDRTHPNMGLYDRDIVAVYTRSMSTVRMAGLNSDADDAAPFFSGDGNFIIFHSRRTGGQGGSDVYMYRMSGVQETPAPAGSETGDIKLTETSDGVFTVPATSGSTTLNLLVDTGLSAVVLFEDKVPSGIAIAAGGEVSLKLPGFGVLNGKAATADMAVGSLKAAGMQVVLAKSSDYAALTGLSLSGTDGIFGMYRKRSEGDVTGTADIPLSVLQPEISMAEFNFDPDGVAGLSLGNMPMIAGVSANSLFNTYVEGRVTDTADPEGTAFTDLEVTVTPVSIKGEDYIVGAECVFLLSSTLKNRIILDTGVAAQFGDLNRWEDIYLFAMGSEAMLRTVECPAGQAQIKDLSGADYDGIIGIDFWQDFVVGFDTVGLDGGGPSGVVSFLRRSEIGDAAAGTPAGAENRHFVKLQGLNSSADDSYGDISDDGNTIVFQSNRAGSDDIYVWRNGQGLVTFPGLNDPAAADMNPRISGNGRYAVFCSDRSGNTDIYLYDLTAGDYVDLPGLNTGYKERFPDISADGTVLAFMLSGSPDNIGNNADIRLYSISSKKMLPSPSGWFNTSDDEVLPSLNRDGTLTAFGALERDDSQGAYDVCLWKNTEGRLADLSDRLNTAYAEGAPSLSADGGFVALVSDRNSPELAHRGRDIFLFDLGSEEFLFLPGMNSEFEEGAPALSDNAKYILFHSKRPGGQGGYDIYLYARDTADNTDNTVSASYAEDGTVIKNGNPVANATVSAVGADGKTLATATADSSGKFNITVPVGAALPVTYQTGAAGAKVVTDEAGDDTDVPDFGAGNLKFTRVWSEDRAENGFLSTIKFDIEAAQPAYNISVKACLKSGSVSEADLSSFEPDYILAGVLIDRLGQRGADIAEPIVREQKGIVTVISYVPGSNNLKAQVEHSFIVPWEIKQGLYTAVFEISLSGDQGEETDLSGTRTAVSEPVTVITPDKPDLRILSAKLDSNSFELPSVRPDAASVGEISELNLNMEVMSAAQDTALPVDVTFELEIDGQKYPMSFLSVNAGGLPFKSEKQTCPAVCRPEDREGLPAGTRCASLFSQEQLGKTYQLFINGAAYDALKAKTDDTTCTLIVTLDPANTVSEYSDNKLDNVMQMPVICLRPMQARGYSKTWFDCSRSESYGNNDFGAGCKAAAGMTYKENTCSTGDCKGITYPSAANFDGSHELWAKVFGYKSAVLNMDADFDFNGDKVTASYFDYSVKAFDKKVWGKRYYIPASYADAEQITLWNTKDAAGNEKYAKDTAIARKKEKNFMAGPVPITAVGGMTGEIGIRGEVRYVKTNKLILEAEPYASLTGTLERGAGADDTDIGVSADLLLIKSRLKLNPGIQILPSSATAAVSFSAPVELSTLGGKAHLFAKPSSVKYRFSIVEWEGVSYKYRFLPGFSAASE